MRSCLGCTECLQLTSSLSSQASHASAALSLRPTLALEPLQPSQMDTTEEQPLLLLPQASHSNWSSLLTSKSCVQSSLAGFPIMVGVVSIVPSPSPVGSITWPLPTWSLDFRSSYSMTPSWPSLRPSFLHDGLLSFAFRDCPP